MLNDCPSSTGQPSTMGRNKPNQTGHHADGPLDLVCVGFGPASLAIAVALHDLSISAKVLFLERQPEFAWHAGMLLPGARMQISFLKDVNTTPPVRVNGLTIKLATFRDPRSYFTFLNYLKCKNRLEAFSNLGTFLPLREEFNDYLTWAAGHFTHQVQYSAEVTGVAPAQTTQNLVDSWDVTFRNRDMGNTSTVTTKHVVIAIGGTPKLPRSLQNFGPRIIHSSQYLSVVSALSSRDTSSMRLAVIGGGQSAAEIFHDLTSRYPKANVCLFTAGSALRPSDDSPLYVASFFSSSFSSSKFFKPNAKAHPKAFTLPI